MSTQYTTVLAGHGHFPDSTYDFKYDYKSHLPCSMSANHVISAIKHSHALSDASRMWASTHSIEEWHQTEWSPVSYTEFLLETNNKFYVQEDLGLEHASLSYYSFIRLPAFLHSFIDSHVRLHISKEMYLNGKTLHFVTTIKNIPVLGECHIHTMIKYMDVGVVISANEVTHSKLPWYYRAFKGMIYDRLKTSIFDFNRFLSLAVCGPS